MSVKECDGHTINQQFEQERILSESTIRNVYVDLGYRGVDVDNPTVSIQHRGKSKRLTEHERRLLKRRQAIEPIIGHHKADRRMTCCHLKGQTGDAMHTLMCAAGYNIRCLLRIIRRRALAFFVVPPGTAIGNMSPGYVVIGKHQTGYSPQNSNRPNIRLIKTDFSGTTS
jgi:hypothetical protein